MNSLNFFQTNSSMLLSKKNNHCMRSNGFIKVLIYITYCSIHCTMTMHTRDIYSSLKPARKDPLLPEEEKTEYEHLEEIKEDVLKILDFNFDLLMINTKFQTALKQPQVDFSEIEKIANAELNNKSRFDEAIHFITQTMERADNAKQLLQLLQKAKFDCRKEKLLMEKKPIIYGELQAMQILVNRKYDNYVKTKNIVQSGISQYESGENTNETNDCHDKLVINMLKLIKEEDAIYDFSTGVIEGNEKLISLYKKIASKYFRRLGSTSNRTEELISFLLSESKDLEKEVIKHESITESRSEIDEIFRNLKSLINDRYSNENLEQRELMFKKLEEMLKLIVTKFESEKISILKANDTILNTNFILENKFSIKKLVNNSLSDFFKEKRDRETNELIENFAEEYNKYFELSLNCMSVENFALKLKELIRILVEREKDENQIFELIETQQLLTELGKLKDILLFQFRYLLDFFSVFNSKSRIAEALEYIETVNNDLEKVNEQLLLISKDFILPFGNENKALKVEPTN